MRRFANGLNVVQWRAGPVSSCFAAACLVLAATGAAIAADDGSKATPAKKAAGVDFGRQVQPIFARRCFSCHGPDKQEAGLRLNKAESVTAKLESGERAVVPGKPQESELLKRISSTDDGVRMPPEGKPLSEKEIELVRQWIASGAEWKEHWAFQPLTTPSPPAVDDPEWSRNPIDAFILAGLKQNGLTPNPPTDKLSLLRRATYDLTGLPPTPAEIDAFLADESPEAFAKVVDRLLASERYGERWGRHWLDLVRFAETNSYERDGNKPNAWRYRDYVIKSFNDDKPFDRFVLEQLAGDELPDRTSESIIATGFLRLGVWQDEPVDEKQSYYDEMDDIVTTTSQAFLGLTINCARCHDHKIDPILQADYYRMVAFLHDVTTYGARGDQISYNQTDISPPELLGQFAKLDAEKKALRERMAPIEKKGIEKMSAEDQRKTEGNEREKVLAAKLKQNLDDEDWLQYAALKKQWDELQSRRLPPRQTALSVARRTVPPPETFVMLRGNAHALGPKVVPGYPALYGEPDPEIAKPVPGAQTVGQRTILAKWITSPDNRLTSRVLANRIWQFHFGRGIVRSPNNFGLMGDPPTHPELLDWLATSISGTGKGGETASDVGTRSSNTWRLKPLHRLIMLSKAYRMSSQANAESLAKDPRNDNFWRFDMRRLSAEEIRDSIYAVTGKLNPRMYGPGIFPEISQEVLAGQSQPGAGWGKSSPEDQARRSVYIHVKRSLITPMLSSFDFPDPDGSCEARFVTTQPAQALSLINGQFIHDRAKEFAARLRKEAGDDAKAQVTLALRLATQRPPSDAEVERGVRLLDALRTRHALDAAKALDLYALTVLNLNEFVYLD